MLEFSDEKIASPLFADPDDEKKFIQIIDDLCTWDDDPELKEGLAWIDRESRRLGITFYEFARNIIIRESATQKASEWLNEKNKSRSLFGR